MSGGADERELNCWRKAVAGENVLDTVLPGDGGVWQFGSIIMGGTGPGSLLYERAGDQGWSCGGRAWWEKRGWLAAAGGL
jgi:hypothetical protein